MIEFEIFKDFPIRAYFTTKSEDVSEGLASNLKFIDIDETLKEKILSNYKKLAKEIGVDISDIVLTNQKHGTNILEVDESYKGMGVLRKRTYDNVDGLISKSKDIVLIGFFADCVPIFYYDKVNKIVGITHGGWRGTINKIPKIMIEKFESLGSKKDDIIVTIGPCICKDCYEVKDDVINKIHDDYMKEFIIHKDIMENKKTYLDLRALNKKTLIKYGIKEENIEITKYCTKCNEELFFSHRRLKNQRGNMLGIIRMV